MGYTIQFTINQFKGKKCIILKQYIYHNLQMTFRLRDKIPIFPVQWFSFVFFLTKVKFLVWFGLQVQNGSWTTTFFWCQQRGLKLNLQAFWSFESMVVGFLEISSQNPTLFLPLDGMAVLPLFLWLFAANFLGVQLRYSFSSFLSYKIKNFYFIIKLKNNEIVLNFDSLILLILIF